MFRFIQKGGRFRANLRNHPGVRPVLAPSMPGLTWTCHVCGTERRDRYISVFTREYILQCGIRVRENVRYCNDRVACSDGASEVYFVPDAEGEALEAEQVTIQHGT